MVKRSIYILSLMVVLISGCIQTKQPVDYVNPLIDSHKSRWFFFNSACRPFGMVNLSPDNWVIGSWNSGYLYDTLSIRCFSHIHAWQMAGIPVMPTTGKMKSQFGMEASKSAFSHDTEIVKVGYHKVVLDDYKITVELSSTNRVGFHRYQFPPNEKAYVSFFTGDFLAHSKIDSSLVRQVSDTEIEGFSLLGGNFRRPKPTYVYFVARFDHPIQEFGAWRDSVLLPFTREISGEDIGAFVQLKNDGKPIQMKVALSYTSTENARFNMESELAHWDFDQIVEESQNQWNKLLSRIEVDGGTEKQRVKFYTDLWRSLLGRRMVSDVNGQYCDMTGDHPLIRTVPLNKEGNPIFPQYQFDAWWGSHWTLNILWSMVYPEILDGFCNTMVNMYENGGLIPRGPSGGNYTYVMIGDPSVPVFAAAWNKGIGTYNIAKAYEGLRKNAFPGGIRDRAGYEHQDNPVGGGMSYYIERGYVPERIESKSGHRNGASMTLEYAYQDWCLAQLAKSLGKGEDYKNFMQRSQNYRKLWNPESGFMHPREKDGSWVKDFQPVTNGFNAIGFCESNSAIYSNFVPHDMSGLIELFGGNEKYIEFLNSCFIKAEPNRFIAEHGNHASSWVDYENQPSCQMAHLFSYAGAPWLTQKWVRKVKELTFGDISPYGGYNGDEDQGQMGALGVLMAIGLFQIDGGAAVKSNYEITSPIFDKITIKLQPEYYSGKSFVIKTKNNLPGNDYIQSTKLNGKSWNSFQFPHAIFKEGGKLEIELGARPNKSWVLKMQYH
jgi:predicted alpha-1,2-mannosidase